MSRDQPRVWPRCSRLLLLVAAFALPWMLGGCGGAEPVSNGEVDRFLDKVQDHTRTSNQIKSLTRQKREVLAQLPLAQKKLEAAQNKLETLEAELQALGSGEEQAFLDYQTSIQDVEPSIVIIMSQRFLRDYPLSAKREEVRQKLEAAKASQKQDAARQAAEEAKRQAEIEARRRARLAKFRAGEMSTIELKAYLGGKSEQEIITLMGQPTSKTRVDVWNYRTQYGVSSTGKRGSIRLYFNGGRVNSVGLF